MEMDQLLFDDCTTAYRAERLKEKQVSLKLMFKTESHKSLPLQSR